MAGEIFLKEGTIATLEASGASTLATDTAVDANDAVPDLRSGGLSGAIQNISFAFELVCQWGTITSINKGTVAAELYLLPALDGTNYPDIDTTGGSSFISYPAYAGSFICAKAPSASTNMRFHTRAMRLQPWLYKAYILNRSGQTISAGWSLKVMSGRGQYT